MKNIILLSVITTSFIFGANVVNDLTVDQKNEINSNSNFSNGATVSQGQTDIQNNSNVDSVSILQRDGSNAGNSIENTTISGTDSELHQGLTSVNNSRLENADLKSENSVKDVTVTGGKSVIKQGNLIIGGESNVTGTVGEEDPMNPGESTGENIKITQTNLLEDTDIQNSLILQGVTAISNKADVSDSFKLNQNNSITRASASGRNDINTSQLKQGVLTISGGITTNVEQTIVNVMEDIRVDDSNISQSTIQLNNSKFQSININDKNRVTDVTAINHSSIEQSNINVDTSSVNRLYREDRGSASEDNKIYTGVTVDNSDIKQSHFSAINSSNVKDVTYTTHDSSYIATNIVYNSTITNSKVNQDVTELDNGGLTNTTLNRGNTINTVTADDNSKLEQFNVQVKNSTLNNSNLSQQGLMYQLNTTNAHISQGSTIITN